VSNQDIVVPSPFPTISRRSLLGAGLGTVLAGGIGTSSLFAAETNATEPSRRIYKSLKWGMIEGDLSVREKFQMCKELGYDGMELISPLDGLDIDELRGAAEATGMPIHGVVNMRHWQIRMSSPDPAVRDEAVAIQQQAIRDAKALGGDSVLLVPGRVSGDDETHDDVWKRSIVEIRKVLPLASRLGVRVLIENVWNGFCETPEEYRDYIDEIDSPWVDAYFDIGNAWKFSPSQEWIRTLGRRIVKLDIKGWGEADGFGKIGDGDIDWPAVREALDEIGYTGWCTAEVAGGDREELADVSQRFSKVLALK